MKAGASRNDVVHLVVCVIEQAREHGALIGARCQQCEAIKWPWQHIKDSSKRASQEQIRSDQIRSNYIRSLAQQRREALAEALLGVEADRVGAQVDVKQRAHQLGGLDRADLNI